MTTSRLSLSVLVFTISAIGIMQSFESHAMSCNIVTKKMVGERSHRYKDQVQVEITYNNIGYTVDAYFPPEILGQTLRDVWLFKGTPTFGADKPDYDFSMSLSATEQEDGRMHSLYWLKAKFAKDIYIGASYGEGCGLEIQYLVDFNKSVQL